MPNVVRHIVISAESLPLVITSVIVTFSMNLWVVRDGCRLSMIQVQFEREVSSFTAACQTSIAIALLVLERQSPSI